MIRLFLDLRKSIVNFFNNSNVKGKKFKSLPDEIILEIFRFISYQSKTYQKLCLSNKKCYEIISHRVYWKDVIKRYNPNVREEDLKNKNLKLIVKNNDNTISLWKKVLNLEVVDWRYSIYDCFNRFVETLNYDQAEKVLDQIFEIKQKKLKNNKYSRIFVYVNASIIYNENESLIIACSYAKKYFKIYKNNRTKMILEKVETYINYFANFQNSNAVIKPSEIGVICTVAKTYYEIGNSEKAEEILDKTETCLYHMLKEAKDELKIHINEIHAVCTFANTYHEIGNSKKAEEVLDKTKNEILSMCCRDIYQILELCNFASTYHKIGSSEKAKIFLGKVCIDVWPKSGFIVIMHCISLGYIDIAEKLFKELEKLYYEKYDKDVLKDFSDVLYMIKLYVNFKNFEKALLLLESNPFESYDKIKCKNLLVKNLKNKDFNNSIKYCNLLGKKICGYLSENKIASYKKEMKNIFKTNYIEICK